MQYLKYLLCFRIKLFILIYFAPEFVIEIMLSGVGWWVAKALEASPASFFRLDVVILLVSSDTIV